MEMSYQDHYSQCPYCNKGLKSKPTIRVKSASSCSNQKRKEKKLTELGAIIKGTSYPGVESIFRAKGASTMIERNTRIQGPIEKTVKLKELGKMIRG
jgi:hypothetical protein